MSCKKQLNLSLKEKLFIKYYLFGCEKEFEFSNGTKSYAKAYGYDIKDEKDYNVCGVESSKYLKKPKLKEYMIEMLEEAGLNDDIADAKLIEILKNGNNVEALGAIREYNKLKQRITDKLEVKGKISISKLLDELDEK